MTVQTCVYKNVSFFYYCEKSLTHHINSIHLFMRLSSNTRGQEIGSVKGNTLKLRPQCKKKLSLSSFSVRPGGGNKPSSQSRLDHLYPQLRFPSFHPLIHHKSIQLISQQAVRLSLNHKPKTDTLWPFHMGLSYNHNNHKSLQLNVMCFLHCFLLGLEGEG